jgi:hypothetical protein
MLDRVTGIWGIFCEGLILEQIIENKPMISGPSPVLQGPTLRLT